MKRWIYACLLAGMILPLNAKSSRAYDIDCAIMLCMAGGFPPSAVCANAYRVMIRRILPWPSRPPFGICTYAAIPISLGGPGGEVDLNTASSDYDWLNKTRVLWWRARRHHNRDGDRLYSWSLRSCDGENRTCRYIAGRYGSHQPWPSTFTSENGQVISTSGTGRAMMMEYGDYEGTMDHSEWYSY